MTGEIDWRIQAADRNFAASYEKLVGTRPGSELRRYGATVAFDSRIPIRIFNGVAVLEPATTRDLRTALAWIRDRDIPFSVWVREDLVTSVGKTLLEAGVAPIEDGGERQPVANGSRQRRHEGDCATTTVPAQLAERVGETGPTVHALLDCRESRPHGWRCQAGELADRLRRRQPGMKAHHHQLDGVRHRRFDCSVASSLRPPAAGHCETDASRTPGE